MFSRLSALSLSAHNGVDLVVALSCESRSHDLATGHLVQAQADDLTRGSALRSLWLRFECDKVMGAGEPLPFLPKHLNDIVGYRADTTNSLESGAD